MRSLGSPYPSVQVPMRAPGSRSVWAAAALLVIALAGGAAIATGHAGVVLVPVAIGGAIARGHGGIVVLVPVAIGGAVACARRPAIAVVSVFALTGFENTVQAYAHIAPAGTADLLLGALWLGVLWSYFQGSRDRPLWIWPPLLAAGLYLALTFASIFAASSTGDAFTSFRLAGWHMGAIFLVALAPWSRATLDRIVRGLVAAALAVGLYAIFRKLTGPGGQEYLVYRQSGSAPGNLFASFFTPQDLAGWCAMVVPFCVALALAWRGRWRIIAALAAMTCSFAILASDRRAATVGAAAGLVAVLVLFIAARRPFGGRRLAVGFVAVITAAALAFGGYAVTIAKSDSSTQRFAALFNGTSNDADYQLRLARWKQASHLASEEPLGHGLGTVGEVGESRKDELPIAPFLDSSYLKIAVEQGYPLMVLFGVALISLLVGLGWRGVNASNPQTAALAIGACGTILALAAVLYSSTFIERLTALSGWLIIGLAAAEFTRPRSAPPDRRNASPPPAAPG